MTDQPPTPEQMRFRKKPIVVEAYQIKEKTEIKTREGTLFGYPGDWIITGIQGEIYPCCDEIFRATYEPVESSRPAQQPPDALAELRADGWMVAVHNDYRQNWEFRTFWLMTHPDGRYLKGEGKSDAEALQEIASQRGAP